jgi:hypothetical protein
MIEASWNVGTDEWLRQLARASADAAGPTPVDEDAICTRWRRLRFFRFAKILRK